MIFGFGLMKYKAEEVLTPSTEDSIEAVERWLRKAESKEIN